MKSSFFLPDLGLINALGSGIEVVSGKLLAGDTSGLRLEDGWLPDSPAMLGRVVDDLPEIPPHLKQHDCRNNRLLLAAVQQIESQVMALIERFGRARIGIVLGSSTSGIAEGGEALAHFREHVRLPDGYRYVQQEPGGAAIFLSDYLALCGPAWVVSTACTSSAKAFVSARGLLRQGLCDAVLVGGVDSLCKLTINGFAALESLSPEICNPLSVNRRGINIGEGAALFIMMRAEDGVSDSPELLGAGESSDAHHMSAPHPEGIGAEMAMRAALNDAALSAEDVDYVNLHATATRLNDAMESAALKRVFPEGVASSGSKPLTGHTLGAAGATELAFCWLALKAGRLPPHVWDGIADPALPALDLVGFERSFPSTGKRVCMSNSFAFGGSNVSLLIGT